MAIAIPTDRLLTYGSEYEHLWCACGQARSVGELPLRALLPFRARHLRDGVLPDGDDVLRHDDDWPPSDDARVPDVSVTAPFRRISLSVARLTRNRL